jgi:hypothetical protein
MSLEEDNLGEGQPVSKKTYPTRKRLIEADIEHSYTAAKNKKSMGLPLNKSDEIALKSGELIRELQKEAK